MDGIYVFVQTIVHNTMRKGEVHLPVYYRALKTQVNSYWYAAETCNTSLSPMQPMVMFHQKS